MDKKCSLSAFKNQKEESDIQENTTNILENVNVWYNKVRTLVNHARERSMNLIVPLGTILALD